MLASFLKSIDPRYIVEFRTDDVRNLMIIKATRGFLYKEAYISREMLLNSLDMESAIVHAIKTVIASLEESYGHK